MGARTRWDVKYGLNFLHLLLLVSAVACVRLSAIDLRGRCVRRARLAWPAMLAVFCAAIFLLFHVGLKQPAWVFGLALAIGIAAGAAKAFPVPLEVDHMFERVRLPPTRVSLLAAALLGLAVLLELVGSLTGPPGYFLRVAAAPLAAACAGVLGGRAIMLSLRCRRAPHVVLHRF